ncbi:MAG: ABC transporter permease subunit [Arsenophonus sp.]|nr:MAG: ABC transporter permease subunit [Arsenophonus sp.]
MFLKGFLRSFLNIILFFFRSVPIIMLIFWIYFLFPLIFKINISGIFSIIFVLSLVFGAYFGKIIQTGISSIGRSQWNESLALGLKYTDILLYIIFPQVFKMMFPSFINQWIALIKDTSLSYIIGVEELSFVANQVNNREMVYPVEIFLFVSFIYFIFCFFTEKILKFIIFPKFKIINFKK